MSAPDPFERLRLTPAQQNALLGALKWVRRIRDRRDELPASFLDGCDPSPLVRKLERLLSVEVQQ